MFVLLITGFPTINWRLSFILCLVGVAILLSFVLKERSCHDENSQINMKLIWRKFFLCNVIFFVAVCLFVYLNYQKAYQILRLKCMLNFVM